MVSRAVAMCCGIKFQNAFIRHTHMAPVIGGLSQQVVYSRKNNQIAEFICYTVLMRHKGVDNAVVAVCTSICSKK